MKRKEQLVELSLEAYFVFMVVLAVAIALTYFGMATLERRRRRDFVERYDAAELRINAYKKTVIYQIQSQTDDSLEAVVVWRGKQPEKEGEVFWAEKEHFAAFDPAEFLAKK